MEINITQIENCVNCGACWNNCPTGAIHIENVGLFYRTAVSSELCIHCGACLTACPLSAERAESTTIEGWCCASNNKKTVRLSSSGGVFSELANYVLSAGGIVFGAAFSLDRSSVIIQDTDHTSLDELRRSKYVESLTGASFQNTLKQLQVGRMVLYCGTPCQIAGLKSFLKRDFDNLYICDFICGGLPSQLMYRKHLAELESLFGSKAVSVNFRPKTYGWQTYALEVEFQNGKKYLSPAELDPFFRAFVFENLNIREVCYSCPFTGKHVSDLTMADCWSYKTLLPECKTNRKGLSLVYVHTPQGEKLATALHGLMEMHKISSELLPEEKTRKTPGELRTRYLHEYEEHGAQSAAELLGMPKGVKAAAVRVKCAVKRVLWGRG